MFLCVPFWFLIGRINLYQFHKKNSGGEDKTFQNPISSPVCFCLGTTVIFIGYCLYLVSVCSCSYYCLKTQSLLISLNKHQRERQNVLSSCIFYRSILLWHHHNIHLRLFLLVKCTSGGYIYCNDQFCILFLIYFAGNNHIFINFC